jgi:hypothetical protein
MTAAWPDSTTQGGREWITPTARATFYRDVLTADHPKWFADNEGRFGGGRLMTRSPS